MRWKLTSVWIGRGWVRSRSNGPGGVRNRLYKMFAGERLVLPEIPYSIDSKVSESQNEKRPKAAGKFR
jgi:hypothetical protein